MPKSTQKTVELRPFLSRHTLEDFRRPEQQETVLELRRRAISRWLQQLPSEADSTGQLTIWNSHRFLQTNTRNGDHNSKEELEDCPRKLMLQKSQPSESELPVRPMQSTRHLLSMKHTLDKGSMTQGTINNAIKLAISVDSPNSDDDTVVMDPSSTERASDSEDSDPEDGWWSVMSDCVERESIREDTAYEGSSMDLRKALKSGKSSEELFHVKYKVPRRAMCAPPSQSMDPRSLGNVSQTKAPKGEWWVPNVCFATIEDESLDHQGPPPSCPVHEVENPILTTLPNRIQARLQKGQRGSRRRPNLRRLLKRMKEAEQRMKLKRIALVCELERPFHMKRMLDQARKAQGTVCLAPEIPTMEYNAPTSLADLSDFECYVGPLFSSLFFRGELHERSVAHCQNWVLDNLLCFLSIGGWSSTNDHPN